MDFEPIAPPRSDQPADACWNRIGVQGDRSCPRLMEAVHCRNCPVFSAAGQQLFQREAPPEYLDEWTRQLVEFKSDAWTRLVRSSCSASAVNGWLSKSAQSSR